MGGERVLFDSAFGATKRNAIEPEAKGEAKSRAQSHEKKRLKFAKLLFAQ
ncbi:hypothetical protein [Paraburkholderia dilworthii]|nr:hypothetical protein [Paraburkholderia dilworthii]